MADYREVATVGGGRTNRLSKVLLSGGSSGGSSSGSSGVSSSVSSGVTIWGRYLGANVRNGVET